MYLQFMSESVPSSFKRDRAQNITSYEVPNNRYGPCWTTDVYKNAKDM